MSCNLCQVHDKAAGYNRCESCVHFLESSIRRFTKSKYPMEDLKEDNRALWRYLDWRDLPSELQYCAFPKTHFFADLSRRVFLFCDLLREFKAAYSIPDSVYAMPMIGADDIMTQSNGIGLLNMGNRHYRFIQEFSKEINKKIIEYAWGSIHLCMHCGHWYTKKWMCGAECNMCDIEDDLDFVWRNFLMSDRRCNEQIQNFGTCSETIRKLQEDIGVYVPYQMHQFPTDPDLYQLARQVDAAWMLEKFSRDYELGLWINEKALYDFRGDVKSQMSFGPPRPADEMEVEKSWLPEADPVWQTIISLQVVIIAVSFAIGRYVGSIE